MTTTLTLAALTLSCDVDDDDARESKEENEDVDVDLQLAAEAEPLAAYSDCPPWANFCFWGGQWYDGTLTSLSGGDFAINFMGPGGIPQPVYSMRKRAGTYRVKVFSGFNMTGSCKVIGPDGGAALEPVLPFAVLSAKRIEPTAKGC